MCARVYFLVNLCPSTRGDLRHSQVGCCSVAGSPVRTATSSLDSREWLRQGGALIITSSGFAQGPAPFRRRTAIVSGPLRNVERGTQTSGDAGLEMRVSHEWFSRTAFCNYRNEIVLHAHSQLHVQKSTALESRVNRSRAPRTQPACC